MINLKGPNIYDTGEVTRQVYTVRAVVRSGNSGGPMIDPQGRVIGVVFGAALDDQETGFVLTVEQVEVGGAGRTQVDTGRRRAAAPAPSGSDLARDRLVAARADPDRAHRRAGQLLDPLHVGAGVGRQLVERPERRQVLEPAR